MWVRAVGSDRSAKAALVGNVVGVPTDDLVVGDVLAVDVPFVAGEGVAGHGCCGVEWELGG